ncbi:MAG TPA: hypothetical protein VHS99_26795 [Chloroflexota bacterium]|jgi:hypothetical protein|nr:hypothetical protein [Chloroflexota bacterium]
MDVFSDLLAAGWTPETLWSMVIFAAIVAAWATYAIDRAFEEPAH